MGNAMQVNEFSKQFGAVLAVDGLNLAVKEGEVFGFLGRNGAGKTTTIKAALDLIAPTAGAISLFGESSRSPRVRRRVGYLPELPVRYPYMTPRQYLEFSASLYGIDKPTARDRATALLEQVEMRDAAGRLMAGFSKGMMQRVGLAQALIKDPDLLFLDEPTAGLDPLGHRMVKELVAEYAARGKTIIVSSHILAEIEQQCSRVAIIENGKLLADGTLEQLLKTTNVVEVEVDNATPALREAFDKLATRVAADGNKFSLELADGKEALDVSRAAAAAGSVVTSLATKKQSLEDVFVALVGGEENGEVRQ